MHEAGFCGDISVRRCTYKRPRARKWDHLTVRITLDLITLHLNRDGNAEYRAGSTISLGNQCLWLQHQFPFNLL